MTRQLKTKAIVLRTIPWRDTSAVVALFTREQGRLDVIAKGARSNKSHFRGVLEPLNAAEAVIHVAAGRELQILGKVALEDSFPHMRADLSRTSAALAMVELVYTFFRPGHGDAVFYDFLRYMIGAAAEMTEPRTALDYFMLKLASYLGFKPSFENCVSCGGEVQGDTVLFSLQEGAPLCSNCPPGDKSPYRLPRQVFDWLRKLQAVPHRKIGEVEAAPAKASLVTDFLAAYLRWHTAEKVSLAALQYFDGGEQK